MKLDSAVREFHQDHAKVLDEKTEIVRNCLGWAIYPNAAAYTAICCEILKVPSGLEMALVIQGRLPAWAKLFGEGENQWV